MIRLDSEAGAQLLIDGQARRAYWPLSVQFVTQKNQAFRGVVSMVMVLNAMGVKAPPAAGYDAKSDRFLILDVSRYKYPPVWVTAPELYAAMNTVDRDNEGRRRGYVLVGP